MTQVTGILIQLLSTSSDHSTQSLKVFSYCC
jgi:hypothetical protein